MSSYTAEMIHGLDRADSPIPSPPKPRWQVRYQDGSRERSAGIFNSPKAADTVRKRIDRAGRPWPTWRPSSANGAGPSVSRRKQVSRVLNGERGLASIGRWLLVRGDQEASFGAKGLTRTLPARLRNADQPTQRPPDPAAILTDFELPPCRSAAAISILAYSASSGLLARQAATGRTRASRRRYLADCLPAGDKSKLRVVREL